MLLLILGSMLMNAGFCFAQADGPSPHEAALLDRINQARQNPLQAARDLGLNPDQVWADFPELHNILANGLPPLSFNDKLYHAATAHTEDMLDRQYYASVSPEGKTPEQRILESGYMPLTTGETIGFVGFNNFIAPEDAVDYLFRNMFLDELRPGRIEQRNILNPEVEEAGVSIGAGAFQVQGAPTNIYIAVSDFGNNADELVEAAVLRLINEARRDPRQTIEMLSIDETAARVALNELEWVVDRWLPPLAWHPVLQQTAEDQNQDMMQRVYYDTQNPEGLSPFERVISADYSAEIVSETLSLILSESYIRDPFQLARMLFNNMVGEELNPDATIPGSIFNPYMTEAGVGVASAVTDLDGKQMYLYLAVVDLARPVEPTAYLIGNVYRNMEPDDAESEGRLENKEDTLLPIFGGGKIPQDADRNFDLREGVSGVTVVLQPFGAAEEEDALIVKSGLLGSYQIKLSSGFYEVYLMNNGNYISEGYISGTDHTSYMKDLDVQ